MKIAVGALVATLTCFEGLAQGPVPRQLTFEDRVRAQEAIERVYYRHQLGTSKAFEQAVPRSVLEAKVRKYLEQTAALQVYWKTAVTDDSLERELERMDNATRMPERLAELYAALGNDPFLIKECLARATLVDRLTRNFYAFDSKMHASTWRQAEGLHRQLDTGELSPAAEHASRVVSEFFVGESERDTAHRIGLSHAEFDQRRSKLTVPSGTASPMKETVDGFAFHAVLSEASDHIRVASYVVRKVTWETWWESVRTSLRAEAVPAVATAIVSNARRGVAPKRVGSTCVDDTWENGGLDDAPNPRIAHSAVWTGSLMLIWGGFDTGYPSSGWRYDPAIDTWTPMSLAGAPAGRYGHTAVWTGGVMVVWGGYYTDFGNHTLGTGGRYDPVTDTWSAVSMTAAPSPRGAHTAVWTGSVMVIWGGVNVDQYPSQVFNDGGRYDPATDTWVPTASLGAPAATASHAAVWTGSVMVVWGVADGPYPRMTTGGRYDPVANSWAPTATVGAPSVRAAFGVVWTGSEMVVWGGIGEGNSENSGGRYNPTTDVWTPTTLANAPTGRFAHTAIWTGTEVVIWGGSGDGLPSERFNTGARYDPLHDRWSPTSTIGAPSARDRHTAIWTGDLMVVWGGGAYNAGFATGGRYEPNSDSWTPTSLGAVGTPKPRTHHAAAWTGSSMVVWGGSGDLVLINTGGRYDPATDTWAPTSLVGAPSPRSQFASVWTGHELIVWGGRPFNDVNTGERYDPIANTWSPTTTVGAPTARHAHHAVWTGTRMLIWGGIGDGSSNILKTGASYDPSSNTWTPMSPLGAPMSAYTSATWTGQVMFVWGGTSDSQWGGRYDPATDSWMPVSFDRAPVGGIIHTAIWTGELVLVWGGHARGYDAYVGARYNPVTDTWVPMSTVNAPFMRSGHTAVWTGHRMVVWGGELADNAVATGGRYEPATDRWTALSAIGAPSPRTGHSAVWAASHMIVWGGVDWPLRFGTGGQYRAEGLPDDDCDGDGFTGSQGDCDDTFGAVFPGAAQVCDGVNNDCAHPGWPAIPPDEADMDGDGSLLCEGDCDDTQPLIYPGALQACDGINNDCLDANWPAVPANESNADGDPFRICQGDCDDTRPSTYPGAPESCNGFDDNCDTTIDNGGDALCDQHSPCSRDACRGSAGCEHTPLSGPCSDFNNCTDGDACIAGICQPGPPLVCEDGNVCNGTGYCWAPFGCVTTSPLYCEDYDLCNGVESCDPVSGCGPGAPLNCDDGDPCNGSETCSSWQGCLPGAIPSCDDDNVCTADSCTGGIGCVHTSIAGACNDANPCTSADTCTAGVCTGTPIDGAPCNSDICIVGAVCRQGLCTGGVYACDDHDVCTTDVCDPVRGCLHGAPMSCNDFNVCTIDRCDPVAGCTHETGVEQLCDDGNPCTDSTCDPSVGCRFLPSSVTTACDDFFTCTTSDHCDGRGNCTGSSPCDDGNPCTEDFADEGASCACTHAPVPSGTSCNDGNACTLSDRCTGGVCVGPNTPNCTDQDLCTVDTCVPAVGCVHTFTVACDDANPCTEDSCNPSTGCVHTNNSAACDDGNACTSGDACTVGTCRGGFTTACNDGSPCTTDTCSPSSGCVFVNNSNPCNDGNACTQTDACSNGSCVGSNPVNCGAADSCHDAGKCSPASGTCSSPVKPDGTACSDNSVCTTGDTCQAGTCTPSFSGLNEPNPRSTGWYKRLCLGPHSGDQLTDADAVCVAGVASTFAGISTVADICAELQPSQSNGDACHRAEDALLVLALNICRARVCVAQAIDSQCGGNATVGQSLAESDGILRSPSRTDATCAQAKCLTDEINTGRALEMNSLTLRREGSGVRLRWNAPFLEDGGAAPSKYHIWRRALGTLAPFTKIGVTTGPEFLDTAPGAGRVEYEVTAVMY